MPLADIHTRLYIACVIYSLVVGLWAFYLSFKGRAIASNFWGALFINGSLFVIVSLLDIALIISGRLTPDRPFVHMLYTATGALTIPAAYAYTRGGATAHEAGIYGAVCLFLAGIALRAIVTTVV